MKTERVSVIIPAYNEEDKIGDTLNCLDFPWIKEIIVVNDGSKDNTSKKVQGFSGIKLINFKENKGKGQAVQAGINNSSGEVIALVDADTGSSVIEIEKLVNPVLKGEVDVAIASLPIRGGGMGLVRKLADYGLRYLTGRSMKAPLSGQRVLRREILDKFLPLQEGFGLEIAMDLAMIENDLVFEEIECNFKHRITGKSLQGYIHRGKQFLAILSTLFKYRVNLLR